MDFSALKKCFKRKNLVELINILEKNITDQRAQCARIKYKIEHILFAYIIAKTCGCKTYREIEDFVKIHETFFSKYINMDGFHPSDDTFINAITDINPEELHQCYKEFSNINEINKNERHHAAVDGKTMCGTKEIGKQQTHLMTAYDVETGLIAAQKKVNDHENEIIGFPSIIDQLSSLGFTNLLISSDAIAAQTSIIGEVTGLGWDYCFGLKNNQPNLYNSAEAIYNVVKNNFFATNKSCGHGRNSFYKYYFVNNPYQFCLENGIKIDEKWANLPGIGIVESTTRIRLKKTHEVRYYITSLTDQNEFMKCVHEHWHIENNLHWQLDTSYREDEFRGKNGYSPENNSLCFKFGLLICNLGKIFFNHAHMTCNRIINILKMKPDFISDFIGY